MKIIYKILISVMPLLLVTGCFKEPLRARDLNNPGNLKGSSADSNLASAGNPAIDPNAAIANNSGAGSPFGTGMNWITGNPNTQLYSTMSGSIPGAPNQPLMIDPNNPMGVMGQNGQMGQMGAQIISGRVIDDTGKPVSQLNIELRQYTQGDQKIQPIPTKTDEYGRFNFGSINLQGPPSIVMGGDTPNYAFPHQGADPVAKQNGNQIDLTLTVVRIQPSISGVIIDMSGKPVEGVVVAAFDQPGNASSKFAEQKTGADGRFNLSLNKRTQQFDLGFIAFKHPNHPTTWKQVDLRTGSHTIFAVDGVEVSGIVVDVDGKPVEGADVMVVGKMSKDARSEHSGEQTMDVTKTDAKGFYSFKHVPRGKATITASHPTKKLALPEARKDIGDAPVKVDLQFKEMTTLRGKIIGSNDGKPLPQARVMVGPAPVETKDEYVRYVFQQTEPIVTDGKGGFTASVAPGNIIVMAVARGYNQNHTNVSATSGASVTLKLDPAATP